MKLHFKTVELENLLSIVANLEKDKPGEESLNDLFVVEVDELFCDGKSAKNTQVAIDYRAFITTTTSFMSGKMTT